MVYIKFRDTKIKRDTPFLQKIKRDSSFLQKTNKHKSHHIARSSVKEL